jgi:threonyl-tRNA synthetase
MIHRGVLSSMDRLVAYLIERYDGAFPPWLAPLQVLVLPVGDQQAAVARSLTDRFRAAGLRADCGPASASLGARIRRAWERRVPYLAVIGAREESSGLLAVRLRDGRQLPGISAADLIAGITGQVESRSPGLGFGAVPDPTRLPAAS